MATEIIMPQMGLTMTEGTIVKWLKKEGDPINKDEPIVEIMTDKASFEVESPQDGVLLEILHPEGVVVPIATVIALVGKEGEEMGQRFGTSAPAEQEDSAQTRAAGTLTGGGEMNGGGRMFISPRAKRAAEQYDLTVRDLGHIHGSGPGGRIIEKNVVSYINRMKAKLTPLAQKIAAEHGIRMEGRQGSGISGKITSRDVLACVRGAGQAVGEVPAQSRAVNAVAAPSGDAGAGEGVTALPVSGIRKVIAERMRDSASTIPHVTLTTEVDMTAMGALRRQLNNTPINGIKISATDLIIKVCAIALEKHGDVNASWDEKDIKLFSRVNIGLAVATDRGLVVPNIKDAGGKSLAGISREARDLISRAREGKLKPDEMTGGTFTVTNLGMYEIDTFTPIINAPESAILGVGRMVDKPVAINGEIVIRSMMVLSLSFDHRVIDGAPAADFLRTIKQLLENPMQLVLGA